MAVKVVVVGSVDCALQTFFTKLSKLQTKNSFSIAIILGDLFGQNPDEQDLDEVTALLQGVISVPLPTYFALGNTKLPERVVKKLEAEDEVCPNLFFLGRRGTTKTSEGIRIVTLGGRYEVAQPPENASATKYSPTYTDSDAKALKGAHNADILVTNQWPEGVQTGSKAKVPDTSVLPQGVRCIADLCSVLKPRYHFSRSTPNVVYEREPFFHTPTDENATRPITRFINLASFNNASKQKWLYAFSLEPGAEPPAILPSDITASPFATISKKREALSDQHQAFSRFSHGDGGYRRGPKRQKLPPPTPAECFFCLSNPNLATHLITSIGDDTYLTTAKGPLTTSTTFPSLSFPSHILIIPLTHSPTLANIQETTTRMSTYNEMQKYRAALHKMLQQKANGQLGAVTWEVSRSGGVHLHWQFLPVPVDLIRSELVEAAFKVEAANDHYPQIQEREVGDGTGEGHDYFRVWIWSPPDDSNDASQDDKPEAASQKSEKSLILPLSPDFRFDLQFGRRVLAKLLKLDNRANWKDATQGQADEEADAKAFKDAFKEFDFSLVE